MATRGVSQLTESNCETLSLPLSLSVLTTEGFYENDDTRIWHKSQEIIPQERIIKREKKKPRGRIPLMGPVLRSQQSGIS